MVIVLIFRLDGLNKDLDPWDSSFYMGEFRNMCVKEKMNELQWPVREYIVQVARFDPAKGIPNVVDSYARFRRLLQSTKSDLGEDEYPQLLICGHGAVDDPDVCDIMTYFRSYFAYYTTGEHHLRRGHPVDCYGAIPRVCERHCRDALATQRSAYVASSPFSFTLKLIAQ